MTREDILGYEKYFRRFVISAVVALVLICIVLFLKCNNIDSGITKLLFNISCMFAGFSIGNLAILIKETRDSNMAIRKIVIPLVSYIKSTYDTDYIGNSTLNDLNLNYSDVQWFVRTVIRDCDTSVIHSDWTIYDVFYYMESPGVNFYSDIYDFLEDMLCFWNCNSDKFSELFFNKMLGDNPPSKIIRLQKKLKGVHKC